MTEQEIAWRLLADRMQDLRVDITERLDQIHDRLQGVEAQARLTNGRVGKLELARARAEGLIAGYRWVAPTVTSLFCGSGGTLIVLAATGKISL